MTTRHDTLVPSEAEGDNFEEKVDWIKSIQTRNMKFPPKKQNFYMDLGLYLVYYKCFKPEIPLVLVDCEFLGLVEMDPIDMGVTVLAKFDHPEIKEPVITKGYLLTSLFGDSLYDLLPGKGESLNLEIVIPSSNFTQVSDNEYKLSTMQGKYKEEFIPLRILQFLPS